MIFKQCFRLMRWADALQSQGADPSIKTEDYDPYLDPGMKLPIEVAIEEGDTRDKLKALEAKYSATQKEGRPHPDIGCWWTLYDYGLESIRKWATDYKHIYPGDTFTPTSIHISIACHWNAYVQ